jgi:pyridoxine/pyridoxamine 5'-phosphate oxidase
MKWYKRSSRQSKERENIDNFESFVKSNKGTWAAKMVANQPYYFSGPKIVPTLRDFVQRGTTGKE